MQDDTNALLGKGRETRHLLPCLGLSLLPFLDFEGWGLASCASCLGMVHRTGFTPPPLPAEHCKGQSRKGVGDTFGPATVLSHIVGPSVCFCPLFEGGDAVRFLHFVFFVSGPASFGVFLPFVSS